MLEDVGEVLRPVPAEISDEQFEELVDAVERDVLRDRREFDTGDLLGVHPVHHRLLAHPPDPEADRLIRPVPGRGRVLGPVRVEGRGQRGEAVVEHADRIRVQVRRRPVLGERPEPDALHLVQVGLRDVVREPVRGPLRQLGTLSSWSEAAIAARSSRKSSSRRARSRAKYDSRGSFTSSSISSSETDSTDSH